MIFSNVLLYATVCCGNLLQSSFLCSITSGTLFYRMQFRLKTIFVHFVTLVAFWHYPLQPGSYKSFPQLGKSLKVLLFNTVNIYNNYIIYKLINYCTTWFRNLNKIVSRELAQLLRTQEVLLWLLIGTFFLYKHKNKIHHKTYFLKVY